MKGLLFSILLCVFCITTDLKALPAQVIIIRHAEKPATPEGDSLSTKGRERAAAMVPYFMETKELITNGTPFAIYATSPSKANTSRRSIETVTPLAEKLGLTLKSGFEFDDYKKMVDEIKNDASYHDKTVLICWEHSHIPEIARAFGALQTPGRWLNEVFDRDWVISFSKTGRATFQNIPQRLMYGDTQN